MAPDGTAAQQPASGGPIEMTGMWENVVRVNVRVIRKRMAGEVTNVLSMAGDGDAQS